jgi:DHA1 family multidrug resistance protein-like MFS transporter
MRLLMASWRRTLYIMFFAQLCSAVGFAIIFPFFPLYVADLGATTGLSIEFLSGMVFSSQAFTMMIASPFWGTVADRYGRKLMVERAMFGGTVILLLMAFVTSAEQLVLLRALQGFITGTVSAANSLVAGSAPRERMGYAMGLLQVGQWGGVALGPIMGGALADAFGFRLPFVVTSVLLLIAGFVVLFGVREEFDRNGAGSARARAGFVSEWRHVLSMPGVLPTYGLRFVSSLGRSMLAPIMPLFILVLMPTAQGVSSVTGLVFGIESAAATASAVYLGRLGDRIGHRQVIIGSALAAALFYLLHMVAMDAWQLLLMHALAGIASGGLVAAPSALLAQYTEPGEEGAVYGIDNSIVSGARAAAPLLGVGVAVWIGYRGVFGMIALLMLGMVLMAVRLLPEQTAKRQLKPV